MASDQPEQVQFDPRRARILERLTRLGDGPASMYRDLHRILGDSTYVENRVLLVTHCARELKSAIEKVLLPAGFERPDENGDAAAIEAILTNFNLPLDHAIAYIWKNLKLHEKAHRADLGAPPTLEEIRGKIADFERMLEMLLDELEHSYVTTIYAKIDVFLAKAQPGAKDVSKLRNQIPQNSRALGYFYEKASVERWLEPLAKEDVFDDPPSYAPWPALHFLLRACETVPERVAGILGGMTIPAASFHQLQYLNIVEQLVLERQAALLQRMAEALNGKCEDFIARNLGKAVKRIAEEDADAALAILRRLLTLHVRTELTGSLRDMDADVDLHTYGFLATDVAANVIAQRPAEALALLLDLLNQALADAREDRDGNDLSVSWRAAITPHEQNPFFNPVEYLAEAVRVAAEKTITANPDALSDIVADLLAQRWTFFRRLAIHLVTTYADPDSALARDEVQRDANLQEWALRREYHLLVAKVVSHLTDVDLRTLLDRILAGPQAEEVKRLEDRAYAADYAERWTRDRLAWVETQLSDDARSKYVELVAKHGSYEERSDFTHWITQWHGPKSPIPSDQLGAMTLDDLLAYLVNWEPQGLHMVPTREGLGRDLQMIAKMRAAEFSGNAPRFMGLDATYVRSVLSGLEAAVKGGVAVDWDETLKLCAWIVAQERAVSGRDYRGMDNDPHWGWARSAIASLFQAGFISEKGNGPSHELRGRIWAVLEPLMSDPDPDAGRDEQLRDPMSTAINSTRGIALEAVMRYIVWVRDGVQRPDGIDGFEDLAEARAMLDLHLDPAVDTSPAVRAVYGQWLFFLHHLAPAWVAANIERLFPASDPELEDATLESYAVFGQYTSEGVRQLLEPVYRRALQRLHIPDGPNRTGRESTRRLGQQFIIAYLDGDESLEPDSLLSLFFDRADVAARADTLAFAVQQMKDAEEHETAYRERCIALWQARASSGDPGELRAFGRWVAEEKLDPAWRLAKLEEALTKAGELDNEFDLMPTLAKLAPAHALAVIRCTTLAVEAANPWRLYSYVHDGDMHRVLESCMVSGDLAVEKEARDVANMLVARDFLEFRDLAERKLPTEIPAIEDGEDDPPEK